jgi:hypothetical protein
MADQFRPHVDPPRPDFDALDDTDLEIPTISVPEGTAGQETESVLGDIGPGSIHPSEPPVSPPQPPTGGPTGGLDAAAQFLDPTSSWRDTGDTPEPPPPPPPVESVLRDLSRPVLDAFSGNEAGVGRPPRTEGRPPLPPQDPPEELTPFGAVVRTLQERWLVSERMAIVFAVTFGLALAGGLVWTNVIACACDERALDTAPARGGGRQKAPVEVVQPSPTPTLVRLTSKIVTVGFDRDGVCDPYVIRFGVLDQTLAGHSVVLDLRSTTIANAMKQPTKFAPPQRVEGTISVDAPAIETPVYAFTSAEVVVVSFDGGPATGSIAFGNKGALDCR